MMVRMAFLSKFTTTHRMVAVGDLTHPSTMPTEFISVPKMFRGKLKVYFNPTGSKPLVVCSRPFLSFFQTYQRKGLSWLVNLYEQVSGANVFFP